MSLPTSRWIWCLLSLLASACVLGAAMWRIRSADDMPPPPVDLPFLQDREDVPADNPTLEQSERELLWDIEHHGNLLNSYGFKRLAQALRDRDTAVLTSLFAKDFHGLLPNCPREIRVQEGSVDVVRSEDTGAMPRPVGTQEFIDRLLEYRRVFLGKPPAIQMVLKTILPRDRKYLEGPWEGLALLRLYGESEPGRPCEISVILRYEVARPTREKLAEPGWFQAAGVRQTLVARASHYLLPDVARQRGLDPDLYHDNWHFPPGSPDSRRIATGGVFVCDFNRDGILDVLITDLKRYSLYRGQANGRFEDVTEKLGLPRTHENVNALSGVAAWIDIDGDGWDDLILAGRVFRNEAGKKLVNYTARTLLLLPPDTVSLIVADYDGDGKLDLYATRTGSGTARSWLDGRSGRDAGNHLFRNRGNWQFQDVTRSTNTAGGQRSTFTAVWLDANEDGRPDLYVINEFGNGVLLVNGPDGTFREHALASGPMDFGSMGVAAGDVNNDGHIDIYAANMYSKAGSRIIGNLAPGTFPDPIMSRIRRFVAGSQLHLNRGGLKFEQAGERMQVNAVGWAYGPVLADLDNDGWLDIFATAGQISQDRSKPDG